MPKSKPSPAVRPQAQKSLLDQRKHDLKNCSKCGELFECKAGSFTICHCFSVKLTADERAYLAAHYDDCLCNACLKGVKTEFQDKRLTRRE